MSGEEKIKFSIDTKSVGEIIERLMALRAKIASGELPPEAAEEVAPIETVTREYFDQERPPKRRAVIDLCHLIAQVSIAKAELEGWEGTIGFESFDEEPRGNA